MLYCFMYMVYFTFTDQNAFIGETPQLLVGIVCTFCNNIIKTVYPQLFGMSIYVMISWSLERLKNMSVLLCTYSLIVL